MTIARRVEEALGDLRRALAADGYALTVRDLPGGAVQVEIAAGPAACAECLIPKDVMLEILRSSLSGIPDVGPLDLRYPQELSQSDGGDHDRGAR